MEASEPPSHKLRRLHIGNQHVAECIRKFTLPQQFPSTVAGHRPVAKEHSLRAPNAFRNLSEIPLAFSNVSRNSDTISLTNKPISLHRVFHLPEEKIIRVPSSSGSNERKILPKPTSAPFFSNGMKSIQKASSSHLLTRQRKNSVSSTNGEPQCKFQKLKLKSPDGKDLGEFQVQFVEQQYGNALKRKLVNVTKHVPSKDEIQGSAVVSSTQNESMISYSINDVQYPGMIYQEPRIGKVGSVVSSKPNVISDISLKGAAGAPIGQVMKNLQNLQKSETNSSVDLKSSPNGPWIQMGSKKIIIANKDSQSTSVNRLSNSKLGKKLLCVKSDEHPCIKNVSQSGKPVSLKPVKPFTLQSLGISKNAAERENSSDFSNFSGTGGCNFFRNGDLDEEFVGGELSSVGNLETEEGNVVHLRQLKQFEAEQGSSTGRKSLKVMLPNRTQAEFSRRSYSGSSSEMGSLQYSDEEDELGSSEDTDDSSDQNFMDHDKLIENEEPSVIMNNLDSMIRKRNFEGKKIENLMAKNPENVFADEEGSSDMSVVERALASVKDKSLREKALKILATCKLGGERQVPIRRQSDKISVRETMTQTNVFGNLERDCEEFIEVKDETKGLKRIRKKEQRSPSLVSKSFDAIETPVDENHTGDQYTKQLDNMLGNLDFGIAGGQEVKQLGDVLNDPIRSNERINKLKTQIQQDVKMLTDYDENGLLGLHRAVMEDNSIAVKRFLMIIQTVKKDVDVKTLDGKTSLELALKTDAGPDIVSALLEAGAKLTSEETGHDSALLIASKNSSPLLPELVKCAKNQALDSMDSEGFTAFHLCALRGNVAGVKALINAGANINLQDSRSGRTALFHALENQHPETARAILAAGATPDIRNNDGQTILPLLDDVRNQPLKPLVYKSMKW